MNELLFIKENFNVVSISFMRNGEIQKNCMIGIYPMIT